jgi:hypothetical protein
LISRKRSLLKYPNKAPAKTSDAQCACSVNQDTPTNVAAE